MHRTLALRETIKLKYDIIGCRDIETVQGISESEKLVSKNKNLGNLLAWFHRTIRYM
jgi:hypothetical protein